MNFITFESFISERGANPDMKLIKVGNIIEYVQPGLGRTSTGLVVEVGKNFVVLVDDATQQRIKVFAQDLGPAYEDFVSESRAEQLKQEFKKLNLQYVKLDKKMDSIAKTSSTDDISNELEKIQSRMSEISTELEKLEKN